MTSRRVALWWRLLLAAGLLLAPWAAVATTGNATVVAVHHTTDKTGVSAPLPSTSAGPGSGLHRTRHLHRSAPMVAAVAITGVAFVVVLLCAGVVRRRASQLAGALHRWSSSRAPPIGTGRLVPIGLASGRAGRSSRSPRALLTCAIPLHC